MKAGDGKRFPSRPPTVLIVNDDPGYGRLLERGARKIGARPLLANDASEARGLLAGNEVSLVLLDRVLGKGEDALKLCLELKKDPQTRLIPVIVLTGLMNEFAEKIKGYRHGADICLSKATPWKQILRYVDAFLHRLPAGGSASGRIACGNVVLDTRKRAVRIGSILHHDVPEKQFNLLAILVAYQGEVVPRRRLIRKLWKDRVRDKELDVLVSRLRRRLGNAGAGLITSIRSQGYCLTAPSPTEKLSAAAAP